MFSVKFALINMKRSLIKGLIIAFVISILVALVFLYDYILETYKHKLEDIYTNMDLKAAISFTPYTSDEDKSIPIDFIEDVQNSGFVKDTYYKMVYDYTTYDDNYLINQMRLEEIEKKIVAINTTDIFNNSVDVLSLEFIDGYNMDKVFYSNEPVCIISVNVTRRLAFELGDTINIEIMPDLLNRDKTIIVPFKIVGTYSNKTTDYTIYTSFGYLSNYIFESNSDYRVNEVIFQLTNLKQLKKLEASFIESGVINSNSYLPGMCCSIDSTEFVRMTNEVKKIISIMESLRFTVYIIIFFIGFIIAYMFSESRRKTLFIMRSMGTKKESAFLSSFFESMIICILGLIIGCLIFIIFANLDVQNIMLLFLFFVVFMAGTITSIFSMLSKNILSILSVKE